MWSGCGSLVGECCYGSYIRVLLHLTEVMAHRCVAAPHRSPGEVHRSAESNTWWGPACGLDVAGSLIEK